MVIRFEFLEHTADTKIRAYGSSLEEAFCSVAVATSAVMCDVDKLNSDNSFSVSVKSNNVKALLYDFLEELLFLFDTEGFIVKEVRDIKIIRGEELSLSCFVFGCFVSEGFDISTSIKAVTYSEMEIVEGVDLVMIQVVLDL